MCDVSQAPGLSEGMQFVSNKAVCSVQCTVKVAGCIAAKTAQREKCYRKKFLCPEALSVSNQINVKMIVSVSALLLRKHGR